MMMIIISFDRYINISFQSEAKCAYLAIQYKLVADGAVVIYINKLLNIINSRYSAIVAHIRNVHNMVTKEIA